MVSKKCRLSWLVVSLIMLVLVAGCAMQDKKAATSEKYPAKPITMIVPYSAGGTADMMGRAIEKVAKKHLGQSLIITNIVGGAATIGWNELAGAKPDGYTIGYVATAALLQPLYNQTRYHYPSALEPLAQVVSTPVVVVALVDRPWTNIDDLVKYAKQNPGEIKFGHSGLGSSNHVAGELFAREANINIAQVPFRGEGEVIAALLGGHVQLMFTNPPAIKEHVKSGKVRVLAVAAEQRLSDPVFNSSPTFKERGFDVVFQLWHGIAAPKGLPAEEKARLAKGFYEIMNDPEFKQHMESLGMTVEYVGPKEFSEKWVADSLRLAKIIQETGIAERIAEQKK